MIPREYAERLRHSAGGQPANERRLVTILFSDIKGSTALAEYMDPEEVLEIINGAFDALITPIYRHEGTLARLMGDAILAFFGAPVAHENDPQRAVHAALEIQVGVRAYAERLAKVRGIQGFNVRVGINTGLVIVGEVGSDLRVEYTAIGDAINTAARMEQNAPIGGVLISRDTYQHVRGLFDVEAQPPLMVKGKAEPLQTYLVKGAQAASGLRAPERGLEGIQTPLIGRESELLWLQNLFQDTMEEAQTRLITIIGEAGVGKSRLLDEFMQQHLPEADAHGELCVLVGRSAPEQYQRSYGVLRNLFAAHLGIQESDTAAQVSERFQTGLAPDLSPGQVERIAQLLGFEISSARSIAGNLETQALDCLEDYFRGLSSRQRMLIILDDIHWADGASLDFVDRLVNTLPERRVLILCLARPALYETRPHWGEGRECYERLDLRPLSRRNTRQLIAHLMAQVPEVPLEVEDLLLKNAEGNPYYTEELARMCLDQLAQTRSAGQFAGADLLSRVPATLTGVLQARLETLAPSEKNLLQQAAVVGREFWDTLLAELTSSGSELGGSPIPSESVTRQLETLRSRAMVARRERSSFPGANEFTFKHAVLQETVYETVLLKQRRQYHARVAAWLEAHAGDRQAEYWPRIAAHYERAGQPERAADFWQRTAEHVSSKSIWHEAEHAYRRVLDLLPADAPDGEPALRLRRARVLSNFGQAKLEMGDGDQTETRAYLEESIRLAKTCTDEPFATPALLVLAEAHDRLAITFFFGLNDYSKGWEQAALSLQVARQSGKPGLIAEALSLQGVMLVFQYQLPAAEKLFLECVKHFRQHTFASAKEAREASYDRILLILLRLAIRRGAEQQVQSYTAELLEFARHTTGGLDSPQAIAIRFTLAMTQGKDTEAESLARQSLSLARESGDRGLFLDTANDLINVCLLQGRYGEADLVARQALEQARAWKLEYREMRYLEKLARVAQARQDWPAAQAWLDQALTINQRRAQSDPLNTNLSLLAYAGHFYTVRGEWPSACEYFYPALKTPYLENDLPTLNIILLELAEPLTRRHELDLVAELMGALDSTPLLFTPVNERQYITPLQTWLDLAELRQTAAYQRGLAQGPLPLRQRLIEYFAATPPA